MGANVSGLPAALLACSLLPASGKRLFGISIRGILPGIIRRADALKRILIIKYLLFSMC